MTGKIPREFIDQVLARTDIIDIIQARTKIVKRGQNHQGLCPFHQEKSPSFSANHTKQFYYCFGCSASGNAIDFIMRYDQLGFREAMEYLSNQAGLELPTDAQDTQHQANQPLFDIIKQASQHYQNQLRHAPNAIDYLKSRGITGQTAKSFLLGYAPPGWDFLLNTFSDPTAQGHLETTGMLLSKQARRYDRFRDRIIFPIRDTRARVVGFGGRSLGDGTPKYLNSPETPLFHKNNELFGLYECKQAHNKLEQLIITEGYMDVISLHQAGIQEAVATLGTAVNKHHIQKLLRYTNTLIFCFDGDKAGHAAAWKALTACLPLLNDGVCVKILSLPDGHDPDSLVRQEQQAGFNQRLTEAPELAEYFFSTLNAEHGTASLAEKARYAHHANQLIQLLPHGIYKELMINQLASTLGIQPDQLPKLAATPVKTPPVDTTATPKPVTHTVESTLPEINLTPPLTPALLACVLLCQHQELIDEIPAQLTLINSTAERIWLKHTIQLLRQHRGHSIGHIMQHCDPIARNTLAQFSSYPLNTPPTGLIPELTGILNRLHQQDINSTIKKLIEKSKNSVLSGEERAHLNELLLHKNKKLLDC